MTEEIAQVKKTGLHFQSLSQRPPHSHSRHLQFTNRMAHRFLRTAKKILSHSFHTFFWHTQTSWNFPFTKAPHPVVWNCWYKLRMLLADGGWLWNCRRKACLTETTDSRFKLQHTKRFLLRSRHFLLVTSRTERGGREWDCACDQNLNTCCFVPCGKQTSACISKAVLAA
jgi:hypothetical protein